MDAVRAAVSQRWARFKSMIKLYGFIGMLTFLMSIMETNDPGLLFMFALPFVLLVASVSIIVIVWLLAHLFILLIGAFLASVLGLFAMRSFWAIESMELSTKRYNKSHANLIDDADAHAEGGYAAILASMPRTKLYSKEHPLRQTVPPDVDPRSRAYLATLIANADQNQEECIARVLLPVNAAAGCILRTPPATKDCPIHGNQGDGDFNRVWQKACTCTYSRPPIRCSVKGVPRCVEKTRQDYGGDYAQLKDILRASVYANTLVEFQALFQMIEVLDKENVIEIEQIKNRFIIDWNGYRDMNYNIRFMDGVCELQLHIAAFIPIKQAGHRYYAEARALGLAGPLPKLHTRQGSWAHASFSRRLSVVLIDLLVGLASSFLVAGYVATYLGRVAIMDLVRENPWEEVFSVEVETGQSLNTGDSLVALTQLVPLDFRDRNIEIQHGGFTEIMAGIACMVPFLTLLTFQLQRTVAACSRACRRCTRTNRHGQGAAGDAAGQDSAKGLGRTAIIYQKYFGVNGSHFHWKVSAIQLVAVFVQASRLSMFGVMTGVCQAPSSTAHIKTISQVLYWTYVSALITNTLYPPAMCAGLLSRGRAIIFDASLDLVYITTYLALSTISNVHPVKQFPVYPADYIGLAMPIMHAYTLRASIIASSMQAPGPGSRETPEATENEMVEIIGGSPASARVFGLAGGAGNGQYEDDGAGSSNTHDTVGGPSAATCTPVCPPVAHALFGLGIVALMAWSSRDVYPIASVDCLPCYCTDAHPSEENIVDVTWANLTDLGDAFAVQTDTTTSQYCIIGLGIPDADCTFAATRPVKVNAMEWLVDTHIDTVYVNGRDESTTTPTDMFLNAGEELRVVFGSRGGRETTTVVKLCAAPQPAPPRALTCKRLQVAGTYHIDLSGTTEDSYSTGLADDAFDGLAPYLLSLFMNGTERPMMGTLPSSVCTLTGMQYMFTETHAFGGTLPADLKNLTSLRVLSIVKSDFSGTFPASDIAAMTNLEHLIMYQNYQLSGTISSTMDALVGLRTLLMHEGSMTGSIPSEFGALTNLEDLLVHQNSEMSGTLPTQMCGMGALRRLWAYDTLTSGTIPTCIGNITTMQEVNLHNGRLSGWLPSTISSLTGLEMWTSSTNDISGVIPPYWPAPLQSLLLNGNSLSSTIPPELASLTDMVYLRLANNNLQGSIPSEPLAALTRLQSLTLGSNNFRRTIPSAIGALTELRNLEMSSNTLLSGHIPSELGLLTNLRVLGLTELGISGHIPSEIGLMDSLYFFTFFTNEVEGFLPSQLGALSNLVTFKGYSNKLSGTIPSEYGMMTRLQAWSFYANIDLSGTLPTQLGAMTDLEQFVMRTCRISGTLPTQLQTWTNIEVWNIFNNDLEGFIPSEFSTMTSLSTWMMHRNSFSGSIPTELAALTNLATWRINPGIDTTDLDALGTDVSGAIDVTT